MTQETKVLTGIGIATAAIIVVGAFFLGGNSNSEKATPPADLNVLIRPDSHKISSPNAKVTIVEFGDFQCPACGVSYPVVKQLLSVYKNKIVFVFRQYPLSSVHKNAEVAALASEAAGGQDKFFEMYDLLFENQTKWSESQDPLNSYFVNYAKEIKLDVDKFKKDVNEKTYDAKIKKDQADGNSLGINSTPTFFINGQMQSGGLPYNQFKAKIDEVLKNK